MASVIATEDRIVHDDNIGIDRKVFAGQPVPPDLAEAYEAAGGSTGDAPAPEAASGQVIARSTIVVHDENLKIDRRLIAGQPVPPDLLDAYRAETGEAAPEAGEADDAASYDDLPVDKLKAEVDARGIDVEGTGQDGRVLKSDLVAALQHDDEE